MRRSRSLAGSWQFQVDPGGVLTVNKLNPDREITVPLPWQAAFPDLKQYGGYAWYRRDIDLDEDWLRGHLLLRFGAVDYWCMVYVNGTPVGEHEGGYTPFTIPIEAYARSGRNEIAIRVFDPVQAGIYLSRWPHLAPNSRLSDLSSQLERGDLMLTPGSLELDEVANRVPHGKQDWYINVGGIWQDVLLTSVPAVYVERLQVTTDIHTGEAALTIELGGDPVARRGGMIDVIVQARDGQEWNTSVDLEAGQQACVASVTVPDPRLWSPDSAYLYTAVARLRSQAGRDELRTRFGFREIASRDGQLLLNGEPFYLLSALDQDFYPDTIYTVPSEQFLRDQFRKARALGFNNLRCHIKPPDPLYLDLADEMGLTVWEEIPSWKTLVPDDTTRQPDLRLEPDIKRRVAHTLEEMIRRDYNHPSLIAWTMVNEDWGTSLPLSAEDRRWVSEMYDLCKRLDPTRLAIDNSACPAPWGPNIHVKSDLEDFHIYANIPDQARSFEHTIEQFSLRPGWTYSAHGDSQRSRGEPLVLSEFGNWGLPSLAGLKEPDGSEPDWFRMGPWWSRWEGDPGWPAGTEERFDRLGLGAIWERLRGICHRHAVAPVRGPEVRD